MIKKLFFSFLIAIPLSFFMSYFILERVGFFVNDGHVVASDCSDFLKEDFYYPVLIK